VNGNVVKSHGSSNRQSWKNAIRVARDAIQYDLNRRIEVDVASANRLLQQKVA
jgi:fatty acid/phospholipid biosynthesis enzyme